MDDLTSSQKKYLRGLAHHLEPVVIVGHKGVTPELLAEVSRTLNDHELIKVRFNDFKDEKDELAKEIASSSKSAIAGIIGNQLILYKEHPAEDERRISLPDYED